ncbi:unnamed protein product [Cyprideis torosa]|uniref:Uncharacterized protein n=1 Tax=Cyprideis torosa TaxID=163714 RepID=A0A7R8ZKG6_9CRUS|nr:unnamed protein product [Cyprideis torosa]CAG0889336.1 unnamed protein product [Cyprideis torosa]
MEMSPRIVFAFFLVSIATFIDGKAWKETEKFQKNSHSATNVTTQISMINGGQRQVDCFTSGEWVITYGEVNVTMYCDTVCSPVTGIDISMLSLTHPRSFTVGVTLNKDGRQILVKDPGNSDDCDITYDHVYLDDVTDTGYLEEFCGILSSPPRYLPREPLSQGFQDVLGCGSWTLSVTDNLVDSNTGIITTIGLRYVMKP